MLMSRTIGVCSFYFSLKSFQNLCCILVKKSYQILFIAFVFAENREDIEHPKW